MQTSAHRLARCFECGCLFFALATATRGVDPVWSLVSTTGPRARDGHAMAYDTNRKVVVLFGGHYIEGGHKYLNDTWEWDGAAWKQVASTGPSARSEHAMAYDSVRRQVVLFGGFYFDTAYHYLGDTWGWNGSAWAPLSSTGPPARSSHVMAFHAPRARVMLFGGSGQNVLQLSDLWEWDGTSWKQVAGAGPIGRVNATIVYDGMRMRLVLFGGDHYDSGLGKWVRLNDTWYWDRSTASWQQQNPVASPPARSSHAMAAYGWPWSIVLFAGVDGGTACGDTWMMDGATWRQTATAGPPAGSGYAMAYHEALQRVVLFGPYGDTWEYRKAPYTFEEIAQALAVAGGLMVPPNPEAKIRLDIEPSGPLEQVDIRDAVLIARKVAGLETNP